MPVASGGGGGELVEPHLMPLQLSYYNHPGRLPSYVAWSSCFYVCFYVSNNSPSFPPSATPSIRELMSISVGHLNMIQSVGTRYPTLGIFLLEDDNAVLVEALTLEHQRNAEEITRAIFQRWIGGTGRKPTTWRTLVGVLRQSQLATQADAIEAWLSTVPKQYSSSSGEHCSVGIFFIDVRVQRLSICTQVSCTKMSVHY